VWQPPTARPGAGLPVLVYFYGGGFVAGDGSEPRYDGESMARRGVVVVTLSYRLGVFGFFAHPALTAESPERASGNYALMDQAAALRWVQANAAAFGGDPRQVTIAGESAGSFSVSAQMASPLARGCSRAPSARAAPSSRPRCAPPPRADVEQAGVRFAALVGRTLAGRAARPVGDRGARGRGAPRGAPLRAERRRALLPRAAVGHLRGRRQARVPLLAGWNSEEMAARALLPDDPTPETARALFARVFGDRAADAAQVFPAGNAEEALQSVTDLAGDQFIGYSTWKWLDVHGRTSGQPVYRYLYARPRPPMVPEMGNAQAGLAGGVVRGGGAAPGAAAARRRALGGDRVRDGQPAAQQGVRLDARRLPGVGDHAGLLRELRPDGRPERRRAPALARRRAERAGPGAADAHRRGVARRARAARALPVPRPVLRRAAEAGGALTRRA
jgi:para-nitrobenzyl esterase